MAQGYTAQVPQRLWTNDGEIAVGWKLTTYVGGSSTPLTTYSDTGLSSQNTNPIVTDASGFFRCYVAKGVIVKFAVTDENDVPQSGYSIDGVEAMIDPTTDAPPTPNEDTGVIKMWSGDAGDIPSGYLLCDGTLVLRATYADLSALYAAMTPSYPYGAGNGTTTFALPNLVGRFPLGVAASGTGDAIGDTGGLIDHVHTGPSHTHTTTVPRTGWTPTASPVIPPTNGALSVGNVAGAGQFSSQYESTVDQTITSSASGTGNTGTANPPFLSLYFIVKT